MESLRQSRSRRKTSCGGCTSVCSNSLTSATSEMRPRDKSGDGSSDGTTSTDGRRRRVRVSHHAVLPTAARVLLRRVYRDSTRAAKADPGRKLFVRLRRVAVVQPAYEPWRRCPRPAVQRDARFMLKPKPPWLPCRARREIWCIRGRFASSGTSTQRTRDPRRPSPGYRSSW